MLIRMRRMMLIAASWPSNRAAAVTKRTLLVGRYSARALNSADRSVIEISPVRSTLGSCEVGGDIQGCRSAWRFLPPRGAMEKDTVSMYFVAAAVARLPSGVRNVQERGQRRSASSSVDARQHRCRGVA